MKLSRMGDLAGVRIILPDLSSLQYFMSDMNCEIEKNGFKLCRTSDYITNPKSDGYRGIHQLFQYNDNQLQLEFQIRTQLQHEWEILGTLMKTPFKIGQGDDEIRLFLKLCSFLFTYEEGSPVIEDFCSVPKDKVYKQLKDLNEKLGIIDRLSAVGVIHHADHNPEAAYYLLILDLNKHHTRIFTFEENEKSKATRLYFDFENQHNKGIDVVLVSVDDVRNLKSAYPNYFLDTHHFIQRIGKVL